MFASGYSYRWHVPAEDILRFLEDRPDSVCRARHATRIARHGQGCRVQAYDVFLFCLDGSIEVFASYPDNCSMRSQATCPVMPDDAGSGMHLPNIPLVALAALLALGACAVPMTGAPDQPGGFIAELPEQVVALAAPYQDLQAVRVRPEDGCYWYRHVGPVETTMLPLRTASGSPICTRSDDLVSVTG